MSLSPFEKAVSGSLASVMANSLVYPLDLSKTIIQTQLKKNTASPEDDSKKVQYKNTIDCLLKIYDKKGLLGWYHGMFSSLFGTALQNFSYFYWYTLIRKIYGRLYPNKKKTTSIELFLGMLAAAISQVFTMPVSVITTSQQTDKNQSSFIQTAKDVIKQDGLKGLWRGMKVSLVLTTNPSITYGTYERLRSLLFNGKEYLKPMESFALGVLSKSLATVATQPLIVSKAMMQKKSYNKANDKESKGGVEDEYEDDIKFDSFPQALVYLYKNENAKGLYKGLLPQLTKGVIVQGLLFTFKDQIDLIFILLLSFFKLRRNRLLKKI